MFVSAIGPLGILFKTLASSRKTVDLINQACSDKGLPPAFPINESGNPQFPGDTSYQFNGFGFNGFPPQVTFWVHYKPNSPEHVELGKFAIPLGFGNFWKLGRLLAQ